MQEEGTRTPTLSPPHRGMGSVTHFFRRVSTRESGPAKETVGYLHRLETGDTDDEEATARATDCDNDNDKRNCVCTDFFFSRTTPNRTSPATPLGGGAMFLGFMWLARRVRRVVCVCVIMSMTDGTCGSNIVIRTYPGKVLPQRGAAPLVSLTV